MKDLLHEELSLTWVSGFSANNREIIQMFVVVKKSQVYCRIQDLESKTMPDSSDSDRDNDIDQVPSEGENSVTCVPATDDEDSSVAVLSEDNKRPLQQSSSLRSSTTRAQEFCCLTLKDRSARLGIGS